VLEHELGCPLGSWRSLIGAFLLLLGHTFLHTVWHRELKRMSYCNRAKAVTDPE
jgi:hypothetical protein